MAEWKVVAGVVTTIRAQSISKMQQFAIVRIAQTAAIIQKHGRTLHRTLRPWPRPFGRACKVGSAGGWKPRRMKSD